ncbi:MAG TPA: hypothetical protein VK824_04880 [Planctomycetota bacterium]|nr:hypothetical protein [Planctomycetota bacterium]
MLPIPDQVLVEITQVLDAQGIDYAIGGSVAAGFHGQPRSTLDIDLIAWLTMAQAEALAAAVRGRFYVPETSMRAAVEARSCFNLIHLEYAYKVDIFVAGARILDREERQRRIRLAPFRGSEQEIWVAAPEIVVLRKLDWFRRSEGSLARQWPDVLGVLKVKSGQLDVAWMRSAAAELGLSDLLERALAKADAAR